MWARPAPAAGHWLCLSRLPSLTAMLWSLQCLPTTHLSPGLSLSVTLMDTTCLLCVLRPIDSKMSAMKVMRVLPGAHWREGAIKNELFSYHVVQKRLCCIKDDKVKCPSECERAMEGVQETPHICKTRCARCDVLVILVSGERSGAT